MNEPLINYTLHLADNAMILGHRTSEWCGHGPGLEQDIALTNISLDLIGQARYLYQYAATLRADGSTEDSFAYLRDADAFRNCLLVEQPNGDWGCTILRQFLFSAYQYPLYARLQQGADAQLAAIAGKSLKEVTYHLRWSSEWVIRLGDGTDESHRRMRNAIEQLSPYTPEMFVPADYELQNEYAVDPATLKNDWEETVNNVFREAGLTVPSIQPARSSGKNGDHPNHLPDLLQEMQQLQRAYPGAEW